MESCMAQLRAPSCGCRVVAYTARGRTEVPVRIPQRAQPSAARGSYLPLDSHSGYSAGSAQAAPSAAGAPSLRCRNGTNQRGGQRPGSLTARAALPTFNETQEPSRANSSGGCAGGVSDPFPIRLVELPGKGRGLVAARNLVPGELLLLCRPLALVRGQPQSAQPQPARAPPPPNEPGPRPLRRPDATGAVPLRPPTLAAASATAAAAAAAAGVCSEGALVAELQRLAWGPRQVDILASLYRGEDGVRPGLPQGEPGAEADETGIRTASAGARNRMSSKGNTSGRAPVDLAELADPSGDHAGHQQPATCSCRETAAAPPSACIPAPKAEPPVTHGSSSGLSPEQLAAVVRYNATGLPSDDVMLAKLYGKPNAPYIGLWPAHAMINHSCAPNAVAVVSGQRLSVRCCAPVPAGGEVCITYAGALGLGPLQLRRALLERNHSFRCTCARCLAEECVPGELSQLWTDMVLLASQQLQPRLAAAAAALGTGASGGVASGAAGAAGMDEAAQGVPAINANPKALQLLLDVRSQVVKCCGLFEDTLAQLNRSLQEALWLQASMYPLYETRARCAQLLASAAAASLQAGAGAGGASAAAAAVQAPPSTPGPAPACGEAQGQQQQRQQQQQQEGAGGSAVKETAQRLSEEYLGALSTCLRLQGVANTGSDMHVQLAARYDAACAAHAASYPGPRGERLFADAAQRLERALTARYGATVSAAVPTMAGAEDIGAGAWVPASFTVVPAVDAGPEAPQLVELLRLARELQRQQPQRSQSKQP